MSETIVTQTAEIRISRDYDYYYYSRKENGQTAILPHFISKARAREILESYPPEKRRMVGHEELDWNDGARQWTCLVEIEEAEDGD